MIQDQAVRRYPGNSTSSSTLSVYFRGRTSEGTGSFNAISGVSDLTLVYPLGRTDSVTHEVIRETIVTHLLNSQLASWWSPENQTVEQALRAALSGMTIHSGTTAVLLTVLFDGQFGPVSVG